MVAIDLSKFYGIEKGGDVHSWKFSFVWFELFLFAVFLILIFKSGIIKSLHKCHLNQVVSWEMSVLEKQQVIIKKWDAAPNIEEIRTCFS